MNLKIFLKSKKPIKTIVKDALLIKNGNTVVYVIEDNIAKLKPIKIGIPYRNSIEVVDGLKVGEKIVTRGNERLRPNQKVEIIEKKNDTIAIRKDILTSWFIFVYVIFRIYDSVTSRIINLLNSNKK